MHQMHLTVELWRDRHWRARDDWETMLSWLRRLTPLTFPGYSCYFSRLFVTRRHINLQRISSC